MVLDATPGNEIRTARKSAITTQRIAAAVCGMGLSAYLVRENDQGKFTIDELKKLYDNLGTDGKDTIAAYLAGKFPKTVK